MLSLWAEILNHISQCSRRDCPCVRRTLLVECCMENVSGLIRQPIRLNDAKAAVQSDNQPTFRLIGSSLELKITPLNRGIFLLIVDLSFLED